MDVPPRKRFDLNSLPKEKDALDKFIQTAPKEILFPIMLQLDPKEIRIICESRNKRVRDVCNSEDFQKAYWEIHRRKLMQREIDVSFKNKEFFLIDDKLNRLKIKINNDGKIKSIVYHANVGIVQNIISLIKSEKGYKLGFPENTLLPVDKKEYSKNIERDWFEKSNYADEKGINEFISEIKDILKNVNYKGKNLLEYVKF